MGFVDLNAPFGVNVMDSAPERWFASDCRQSVSEGSSAQGLTGEEGEEYLMMNMGMVHS